MSNAKKIQWGIALGIPIILLFMPISYNIKVFFMITIFGILAVAFDLMDKLVPSLLMPSLYVLLGVADAATVYSSWASTTVSLAIGSLVMAGCLGECGVLERMAYWLLKKCNGNFKKYVGVYFLLLCFYQFLLLAILHLLSRQWLQA